MNKDFDNIDSWKNSEIFELQLSLNKKELNGKYPVHWNSFLEALEIIGDGKLLDIGCGAGAYYELCKKHREKIEYFGCDYSDDAIRIAKKEFNNDRFFVADIFELEKKDISEYRIVHAGALLDLLPNAEDALERMLSWGAEYLIIGRMRFTLGDSYIRKYKAYDLFDTYEYHISSEIFNSLIESYGYKKVFDDENHSGAGQTLLLQKKF